MALEGRIFAKAPVTFDEKTYSFDVTFSVALAPKALPKILVSVLLAILRLKPSE